MSLPLAALALALLTGEPDEPPSLEWDGDEVDLSALGFEDESPEPGGEDAAAADAALGQSPITGALRLVAGYLRYPSLPEPFPSEDDGLMATVVRAMAQEKLGDRVTVETNIFLQLSRTPGAGSLAGTFATAGNTGSAYRYPHASAAFWQDGAMSGQIGFDRMFATVDGGRFSASFGRFPVNHSVTMIFTPNDFFAPFSATAINRAYKPGVDAVRMAVATGTLSSIEVVAAAGFEPDGGASWAQSAILLRASAVLWNIEWAALGGKVAQRFVAGGSMQGDLGPVGFRAEGHLGIPDRDGNFRKDDEKLHGRVAAGPNVNFSWRSATLAAEYGFFSDGASTPGEYIARYGRFFPDDLPYSAQHYVAVTGGLEVTTLLRASAVGLVNATDGSGMAGPFLGLSVSDEADLVFGAYVPWGKRPRAGAGLLPELRSEFGMAPATLYLESRIYF